MMQGKIEVNAWRVLKQRQKKEEQKCNQEEMPIRLPREKSRKPRGVQQKENKWQLREGEVKVVLYNTEGAVLVTKDLLMLGMHVLQEKKV